jgi:hypothetical protein
MKVQQKPSEAPNVNHEHAGTPAIQHGTSKAHAVRHATSKKTDSLKRTLDEANIHHDETQPPSKRQRLDKVTVKETTTTIITTTTNIHIHRTKKASTPEKTLSDWKKEVKEKFTAKSIPLADKAKQVWFIGSSISAKIQEGTKWFLQQIEGAESMNNIIDALEESLNNMKEWESTIRHTSLGEDYTTSISEIQKHIHDLKKHAQ